jgi:HEPN domain-containing protein
MNPLTEEWIAKAEGDFLTARRELNVTLNPNHDAVSFHAQQCAEKYLKALLEESGIRFPKTHDLGTLVSLLVPHFPTLSDLTDCLEALTDMGVEVRYPGVFADQIDAQEAVDSARRVRARVRVLLGID